MEPVRRGQRWKSKSSGVVLTIHGKATGNKHWIAVSDRGKSHKVHEGTLKKFYELQTREG